MYPFPLKALYNKQQGTKKNTYNGTNQDLQMAFEDLGTGENNITKNNRRSK
jgi:hypothetical protein